MSETQPIGVNEAAAGSEENVEDRVLRPAPVAWVVAFLAIFVLTYGFPLEWAVVDRGGTDGAATPVQGYVPALLAAAGLFALLQLAGMIEAVPRLLALEPLLPLFVALALLSALWSDFPLLTLRFSVPLALIVVLSYWMVLVFRLEQLLALLLAVLALGTVVNYGFIFAFPQFGQSRLGWSGVLTDKNTFGRLAVFGALHFALAYRCFPVFRPVWAVLWLGSVGLVIGSESATSVGGLVVTHAVLVTAQAFRARRTLYGAVAVALGSGAGFSIFLATANLGILTDLLGRDVTLTGRTVLWRLSFQEALNKPFLGHGWAGFWQGFLSPARPVIDQNPWNPPHSHNALLEYFLVLGVVGAGIAAVFFARFVVRASRVVRERPTALGLWPLSFASFSLIFSVTEFGVINRNVFFLFLSVLSVVAALDRKPSRLAGRLLDHKELSR